MLLQLDMQLLVRQILDLLGLQKLNLRTNVRHGPAASRIVAPGLLEDSLHLAWNGVHRIGGIGAYTTVADEIGMHVSGPPIKRLFQTQKLVRDHGKGINVSRNVVVIMPRHLRCHVPKRSYFAGHGKGNRCIQSRELTTQAKIEDLYRVANESNVVGLQV